MNLDKVAKIKENLRSFRFEIAFPLILEVIEELVATCNMDNQELNELMLLTSEAMENKDVIRLCDITEFILYPRLLNYK